MNAPKAPDPVKTAQAQSKMNEETATTQQQLNMTNQITPEGTLQYNQVGSWEDGTPRFEAVQTYSPENQALFDRYNAIAKNLGDIGGTLSSNVKGAYSQPFKLGNEETEGRLMELGSKRLDPMFAAREDELRTRLENQGVQPGTPAWDAEMGAFSPGRNDAYNSLLLNGRQLADQELTGERNQTLNEMNAMLSGSQVSNPNYQSTPQTAVSGVDYAGMVQNNYNQQASAHSAMMGGLMGLGGKIGGAAIMASDRRLKENIAKIGQLANGLNVYVFNYLGSKIPTVGLMADEVRKIRPEAVVSIGGFDHVRYDLAVV